MAIHISATTGCNLGCTYCYESPDRERKQEWVDRQYDIEQIMDRLEEWKERYPNTVPGMHGGEPLLVRKEHLERIWSYVNENWDHHSHIQTNGTLVDDDHIEMFKKYNVHVGVSCDGPDDLNRERKAAGERGTDDENVTDKMTDRTTDTLERFVDENISCGVIVVLSKTNAGTDEKLEKLLDWMDWLNSNGISGHYNPAIPYEGIQDDISLSAERLKEVYLRTWDWMKEEQYRTWNPMRDYVDNLLGVSLGNCVQDKCDVFNAGAAKIIMGDGESTGCGKTWEQVGDGVPFLQGPSSDNQYDQDEERYDMLKQVPGGPGKDESEPDFGGCKGCKYWNVCQGGCPSAGINDDYRNRTIWCEAKYALYERIENELRTIMPNITLITDYPWDAELAQYATKWDLDIKPFAAMDPKYSGPTSTYGRYEHPHGAPFQRIDDEVLYPTSNETDIWEDKKEKYKEMYDEDHLTFDKENGMIHADSDIGEWEEVEE